MFNRFAIFVVAIAFGVGWMMPASRPKPALVASAVQADPATGVERDSPVGLKEMVIQRQPNGHFYVDGTVNGQPIRFLVDTGATSVALTADDANRAGLQFSPAEFQQIGYGASGPVMGKQVVLDSVALGRNEVTQVRGVIMADVPGLNVSLLGQSYLERIGSVSISGDEMVLR
jgi:aspartyl protease family protein